MKRIVSIILLFISADIYAQTNNWSDTLAKIENLFSRYKSANPGAQLAISRNGNLLFSKAWGMADLEHNVPLAVNSITEAGSVSKQFTAAAILLLEQQGKLSLNDDIRKYIPELYDHGKKVTIAHMITHTSGFRDWGSVAAMAGWPRGTKAYDNDYALYIASKQKELNHTPGAEFVYSNTNYNLFAVLVQRLSGMSLADFSTKYIFQPAGMKNTQWRSNFKKVVPNRAIAYSYGPAGYETDMPNEYVYGNGGLLTTAEDLVKWNEYYGTGKFGNPSLLPNQIKTAVLNNGNPISYAAGLFISKYKGWQAYAHDGATASYRANLEYWPEMGLSIAFLSNTSQFDTSKMNVAEMVADIFINDKSTVTTTPPTETKTFPVDGFMNKAGWYRDTRHGGSQRIFIRDGKIYTAPNNLLTPVSENMLRIGNTRLLFASDYPNGLKFISPSNDTFLYTRVDSAIITPKKLQEYVGQYYSEEADARYHVNIKEGKLNLHMKPSTDRTLTPTYNDGFTVAGNFVYFERDKKNKVITMRISSGRVRNMAFRKMEE